MAGESCDMPCDSAHTAPAYRTAARTTLRRFSSARKPGLSDTTLQGFPTGRRPASNPAQCTHGADSTQAPLLVFMAGTGAKPSCRLARNPSDCSGLQRRHCRGVAQRRPWAVTETLGWRESLYDPFLPFTSGRFREG